MKLVPSRYGVEPFERFDAWKACHALALEVYRVTESFPNHERYGLTSQARRAAFSAAANIVEGSAKRGRREFRRYLDISLGSLAEVSYVLRLAEDLGLIGPTELDFVRERHKHASVLTWRLYHRMARMEPPTTNRRRSRNRRGA